MKQSAALKPPVTYICHCQRERVMPYCTGLPAGWELRTIRKFDGGSYETALCDDCVAFENSLSPAEVDVLEGRTHDSSSAINDDEGDWITIRNLPPTTAPVCVEPVETSVLRQTKTGYRLWQATLTFHTDKGEVETQTIIGADNGAEAIELTLESVDVFARNELVSITVTPPPLDILGPIMTGGGLASINAALAKATSPADRMMRPKRQVWPMDGMHR